MKSNKSDIHEALSQNTRNARQRLGLSQQELAERARLSPGHINDIEQKRKWLSAASLQRLANALGVEPFMLLLPLNGQETSPHYKELSDRRTWWLFMDFSNRLRNGINQAVDEAMQSIQREILSEPWEVDGSDQSDSP
ncbi:MAG: helix-turn-helix domain-containing protein [Spirochaeta sp.]